MTTARNGLAVFATAFMFLAGCGGGGGGGDSGPQASSATFAFQSSFRAYTLAGSTTNYSISGSCSGTATLTEAPAVTSTFEGVSGYSSTETATINLSNCTPASNATTSTTYFDGNFTPLGVSTLGEEYAKFQTAPPALPATIKVGDTAQFGSLIVYTDSTKTTVTGSRLLSYVVEADSVNSAIVNLISRDYDTANRLLSTQQSRYRITTAGAFSPVSIDVQYSTTSTVHILFTPR